MLVVLVLLGGAGRASAQAVQVEGGLLLGVTGRDASIAVYKGVPFAAPPVGDLRWRAPRPVVAWSGVRRADVFGANCMQPIVDEKEPWTYEFMAHGPVSEDCLFLNVWTAARSPAERRPVYVYVHGGANTEGSGSVPVYDGEGLARKGIVVVTVNYRLGVLGFFTHPELTKESEYRASGNYALLDLVAALRWVRANIAAFGGDPANVTLGGQSAGAGNTHSLVASPLARGLFHRAIAESGSNVTTGANTRTLADQEALGARFAAAKGASIAALRALTWQELTAPVPAPPGSNAAVPAFRFGVVVDGHVLPASPKEAFASGRFADVPTLTGSNKHEYGATPHPEVTAEAFQKQARQRFGDLAEAFLALYPAATDEQARTSQNESAWDQARMSTRLWALERARTARTPVFTYFYDHPLPGPDVERYGAFHTSEVPYVMDTLAMSPRPFTDVDRRIAGTVSSYVANFVRTGDPNGAGLARWPAVSTGAAVTMRIGDTDAPIPVAGSAAKQAFWERFLASHGAGPRGTTATVTTPR
jgi:para-nitrobenzyl esterase